ncbi:hypothetical protein C8R47DRAFT_1211337 [Mycena vitilis]|nr:hypothetical protein C8R47DRAFT_1211337 [Mycena vitilis]
MSCSICRLPFIPDLRRAALPLPAHTPSATVVPKHQAAYFMTAVGVGYRHSSAPVRRELSRLHRQAILGCVSTFRYYSSNYFGAVSGCELVHWESNGSTLFMAHRVCLYLLRHALNVEEDNLLSTTTLCAFELIIGRPVSGADAGRLEDVDYEHVGEHADLSPFWKPGQEAGGSVFEWEELKSYNNGSISWIIQRPDVFPRFNRTVSLERLASAGMPSCNEERADLITTMPLELILYLLPHLCLKSYVALVSTCRFFRYHALTTFQPHARFLTLQLPWALPTRCELCDIKSDTSAQMASRGDDRRGGDWYLYLCRIHGMKSMRVRRWIWALCEEIRRVWMLKLPGSAYSDVGVGVKSSARLRLEGEVQASIDDLDAMRKRNTLEDGYSFSVLNLI